MHSSANKVKLPSIEDIEKLHGNYVEEQIEEEEEVETVDIEAMIREAQQECDRIIANAQAKALDIEKQARANGEIFRKQEAAAGYQDGLLKGQEEIKEQIEEQQAEFERQISAILGYREQMFTVVKDHVVDCLKLLCKKIIFKEFNDDDAVINNMIDYYYSMIKDRTNLLLTVSKDDYNRLNLDSLNNKGIQVKVDETFIHGDLTISCDAQGINFGLSEQLEKMQGSIGV